MILTLYKGSYYNGVGDVVEVKPADRLVKRFAAGDDSYEWYPATATELSQIQLEELHGTPAEFEAAVWKAHDDGFCTTAEARTAIEKYREEFRRASAW